MIMNVSKKSTKEVNDILKDLRNKHDDVKLKTRRGKTKVKAFIIYK